MALKILKILTVVLLSNILATHGVKFEGKVVGGDYAKINQYPHSVFLLVLFDEHAWGCGASILTQSILMTAAHCLKGCDDKAAIDANTGTADIEQDDGEENYVLKHVQQRARPTEFCGERLNMFLGMMCVSSDSPNDYPAKGDSGSALITKDYQQIGIVSMKARGPHVSMAVYTNVSYFYDWIVEYAVFLNCENP